MTWLIIQCIYITVGSGKVSKHNVCSLTYLDNFGRLWAEGVAISLRTEPKVLWAEGKVTLKVLDHSFLAGFMIKKIPSLCP